MYDIHYVSYCVWGNVENPEQALGRDRIDWKQKGGQVTCCTDRSTVCDGEAMVPPILPLSASRVRSWTGPLKS